MVKVGVWVPVAIIFVNNESLATVRVKDPTVYTSVGVTILDTCTIPAWVVYPS